MQFTEIEIVKEDRLQARLGQRGLAEQLTTAKARRRLGELCGAN